MAPPALVAGAATADITPVDPVGVYIAGFGPDRRSVGALEPLEAGALYLASGDDEVVLVTADVVGLLKPWVERIRERLAGVVDDPRAVIVCATHTHSGPDTMGIWGPAILEAIPRASGVDPAYMEHLVERVAEAVTRAKDAARPATLRAATFEMPAEWTRNDRKGGGRFDKATALALDDASDGTRLATVLNFASHPETLWEDNPYLSPDYPGAFRRHAGERTPGAKLFFSGPLGGMLTPNVREDAGDAERRDYAERLGAELAERTEDALADATPQEAPTLSHRVRDVGLDNRNWRFKLFTRLGLIRTDWKGSRVDTEVHHVRLGDVEMLTAPGELVPELGARVDALMSAPHRMLLGLALDEFGYVLEPRMFDDREYRYEKTMSLGRSTADTLMGAWSDLVETS
ncbi:MAG: hypothetical protein ACQEXJ_23125 [Myxococcota bacterium]